MAEIVFDYSALEEAKDYAKKVVTGWKGIDDYKSGLQSKLYSSLDEWKLSGTEPLGHSYVVNARQSITDKRNNLDTIRTEWINLSENLGNYLQYLKDTDQTVVNIFSAMSAEYVDYSGIKGFFNFISDVYYNAYAVDFANCNSFTRAIADWRKERVSDLESVATDFLDWCKHGNGRYVLNILGSVALTVGAVIVAIAAIPFTGGTSAFLVVSWIGVAASTISATISAYNTYYTIKENGKALAMGDDPGMSRFHGDVAGYSDYVKKTDFGSKEANEYAENKANTIDTIKAVSDIVAGGTEICTTFGSTTIEVVDDFGNVIGKTADLDFSPNNIKTNVLKTFGFKVDRQSSSIDVSAVSQTTYISNADEISDTTIDIVNGKTSMDYNSTTWEKTTTFVDGKKDVTKTLTIDKTHVNTEYGSVVASNNIVTQEYSVYNAHASTSTTTIDYTTASSSVRTINAEKAAEKSDLEKILSAGKKTTKAISTTTKSLSSTKSITAGEVVHSIAKENYFINNVDKYLFKYDASTGEKYFGGDIGEKGSKLWKVITKSAA